VTTIAERPPAPGEPPEGAMPPTSALRAQGARAFDFPCFDGLRAIAVMSAILEHVGFVSGAEFSKHSWYAPLVARLEIGPAIFFMISGFLLYRTFSAAAFAQRSPTRPRRFFRRRALRIVPAYWIALTATLLFHHATTVRTGLDGGFRGFTAMQLLSIYSLTQIYSQHWFYGGMSQSWTLAVEITFYLMLPAYALLMRKLGAGRDADARLRLELSGAAALYLVSVAWRTLVFYGGVLPLISQHWLPGYLDIFGFGMALAAVHAWSMQTGGHIAILEWLGRRADLCLAIAVGCYLVVALALNLPRGLVEVTGGRAYARNVLHGLVAVFVLIPAVFGPQDTSLFRRFLRWRPVVYVGLVSYGVYLWHNNFLEQAREWAGFPLFHGSFVMLLTITVAWGVLVASASYFLVELPILRLKDRPLRPRRRPVPERA
jgi:peptidoglycan/LPS O-acetylase OafA/YrhL